MLEKHYNYLSKLWLATIQEKEWLKETKFDFTFTPFWKNENKYPVFTLTGYFPNYSYFPDPSVCQKNDFFGYKSVRLYGGSQEELRNINVNFCSVWPENRIKAHIRTSNIELLTVFIKNMNMPISLENYHKSAFDIMKIIHAVNLRCKVNSNESKEEVKNDKILCGYCKLEIDLSKQPQVVHQDGEYFCTGSCMKHNYIQKASEKYRSTRYS